MLIGYVVLRVAGRRRGKSIVSLIFRIGALWLLPWFAAMALISWFCDPALHPKLFDWVFLANAVVAVAIYNLAMRFRLPKDETEARIREVEKEGAEEPSEAGTRGHRTATGK